MNIEILVSNQKYLDSINTLITANKFTCHYPQNIDQLYYNAIENVPRAIILQDNYDTRLTMLDLVRDFRTLFGAFPTIIIVGEDKSGDDIANFLGVGSDNYFNFPFDITLFQDFLFKSTKHELCLPFKYRNIPSGGIPVDITVNIDLVEINSNGIIFESEYFFTKGVIFKTSLHQFINITDEHIKLKILKNSRDDQEKYQYFAEFYDLRSDLKKKIIYELKQSSAH